MNIIVMTPLYKKYTAENAACPAFAFRILPIREPSVEPKKYEALIFPNVPGWRPTPGEASLRTPVNKSNRGIIGK